MSDNACYGCQNRHVGCHADCEKYKKFKMELKEIDRRKKSYYLEKNRGYYHD